MTEKCKSILYRREMGSFGPLSEEHIKVHCTMYILHIPMPVRLPMRLRKCIFLSQIQYIEFSSWGYILHTYTTPTWELLLFKIIAILLRHVSAAICYIYVSRMNLPTLHTIWLKVVFHCVKLIEYAHIPHF